MIKTVLMMLNIALNSGFCSASLQYLKEYEDIIFSPGSLCCNSSNSSVENYH